MKTLWTFSLDNYSVQIPGPEGLLQILFQIFQVLTQKLVCYLLFQYDNTS